MTHFNSRESEFGTWNNPRLIFPISEDGSGSWNGYRPASIVKSITPKDQQSADFPEYLVSVVKTSGETYAGHPCFSPSKSSSGSSRTTASSSVSNFRSVLKVERKNRKQLKLV